MLLVSIGRPTAGAMELPIRQWLDLPGLLRSNSGSFSVRWKMVRLVTKEETRCLHDQFINVFSCPNSTAPPTEQQHKQLAAMPLNLPFHQLQQHPAVSPLTLVPQERSPPATSAGMEVTLASLTDSLLLDTLVNTLAINCMDVDCTE